MKKRLIITADDFGIAEGVNKGIIECYKRRAITDTSLLAVGESFEGASRLAKENNLNKIGVHLALTGPFKPISHEEEVSTLLTKNKTFSRNHSTFFIKYLLNLININEIKKEFKNQITKIKNKGFIITHIDSHEHIHMMPGILKVVIDLAKENNINYIRFPLERLSVKDKIKNPFLWLRNILLSSICRISKKLIDMSKLKRNDAFIGHSFAHNINKEKLIKTISLVKNGLIELGVHPGYFTEEVKKKHPQYKNCEEEIKILCDKSISNKLKVYNIELVSY